ncbi:MAG: alpha/beta hydrolase family protein [bacterium]
MPRTTGPYAVGTLLVHLVDESREEQSTPKNPDDKRELMVQLWYPADNRAGMQPGVVYPGFEIIQPIMEVGYPSYPTPHVYWDEIRGLVGNAVWNAPLLDTGWQYPLVIYSHGHTAWRHCNLSLLEELASHGYIVASIDHTYNAAAVLFPDGRVIVANGGMDVNLHAQDVRFVLDRLGVIPPGSDLGLFAGRLDLERAGVLGMSFGGDVMAKVMQTDTRFKAGAGLDGGTASKCGRPVMFLWNTAYPGSPGLLEKNLLGGGYSCQIRDTTHIDFSNYPLWWKVFALPGKFSTSIAEDPIRIDRIISEYTLAFFNKMLKGQATPLLSGPSRDYPEVDLTIIGNPHGLSGIRAAEWARY